MNLLPNVYPIERVGSINPPTDNVVLVSSCLNPKTGAYTLEERLQQTIRGIKTIREKISSPYIILLDPSPLDLDTINTVAELVDAFILFRSQEAELYCGKKSLGEVYKLSKVLNKIKECKKVWKISGRYWLNEEFDEKNFSDTLFTCCGGTVPGFMDVINTTLYSLPYSYLERFAYKISQSLELLNTNPGTDIEHILYHLIKPEEKKVLERVGISGYINCEQKKFWSS